ncbi:hypothetical protein AWZ03_003981 [Drosophila navojoa]|uniref:Uncharacterized protein n=1 Tax=Drosophila navojoa TaxID=7232 RepID=A0A484BN64_DRONA|nr:hypothetical protein AWZ03_003981 [Drosophila navojoa]
MANQSQFGKAKKKVLDEAPSSGMSLLPTTSTGPHSAKLQPQALNGRGMGMAMARGSDSRQAAWMAGWLDGCMAGQQLDFGNAPLEYHQWKSHPICLLSHIQKDSYFMTL